MILRRLLFAGLVAILSIGTLPATGAQLIADLSNHLVAITTGFTGADVLLFGATEGEGDVVVVVMGPRNSRTVRRKGRIAGIWVNEAQMTFAEVPGYYAVASSRPLADIVKGSVAALYEIGTEHIRLSPATPAPPDQIASFRDALVRNMRNLDLYPRAPAKVAFLGNRLFRTDLQLPANAPVGTYTVSTFLLRDGAVASASLTPLIVSKVGFEAGVFDFAHRQSLAYGVIAVVLAAVAGWVANELLRRS